MHNSNYIVSNSIGSNYIGRFAPSPTGPLHFGSLIAAVASYCEAKVNHGKWLIRIEDIDKPREMAGAADAILRTLEGSGFEWDDTVIYQSQRAHLYEEALNTLKQQHLIYPCTCSRKEIADSSTQTGIEGKIYPKTCLTNAPEANIHAALRAVTTAKIIRFKDAIQGEISQNLAHEIGDFVLKRADGIVAYQLAVVVDDAAQGVTHIVRGADLLHSTCRQIYLQTLLGFNTLGFSTPSFSTPGFSTPSYAHVPIACNANGEKLSKQTLAEPISMRLPEHQLFEALRFLGQNPPIDMQNATLADMWRWAISHWQLSKIPKLRQISFG